MPATAVTPRPSTARRTPNPHVAPAPALAAAAPDAAWGSDARAGCDRDDALAPLLARSVARRGALLQRKVGFEWEMGSIRPWFVREGTTSELLAALGHGSREDEDVEEKLTPKDPAEQLREIQEMVASFNEDMVPKGLLLVSPVARKQVLHAPPGADWRLEADDTPGPWRSNIEYVTDAFEETPEGLESFHRAVDEIKLLVERLKPAAKLLGPCSDRGDFEDTRERLNLQSLGEQGGPYARIVRGGELPEKLFLLHAAHGLSGSETVPAERLGLSGVGGTGTRGKMQATIGVDLGALSQVMATFGAQGPTIGDPPESLAALTARDNRLYQYVDRAPRIAAVIADRLETATALPGPRASVEGFLSAVVLAVLALGFDAKDQLKYRFVLMPRTSHVAMLESLPGADALRGRGKWLAELVVSEIGDVAISVDAPLMRGVNGTESLTVGRWIAALVDERKDYLLPSSLGPLLETTEVTESDRKSALDRLESFGTVPAGDRRDGELLAIYEHRGIDPPGAPPNIDDVRKQGDAILRYMIALRKRPYPGELVAWPTPLRI